ncbi:MAG: hemerythrin domain-containing protein [Nitrososphaerales archaeon]
MVYSQSDRITPLKNEHSGLRRQLDLVRKAITESPRPSPGELRESIGRLESLVERHFAYEENSLYKPLKRRLGKDNPIDQMDREHRLLRQTLGRLLSASVEYSVNPSLIGDLQSCFKSFQNETGEHSEKEEAVLFWLADLKL